MEYFKIEERNGKYYVIPTAQYLLTINDSVIPLDTNFVIYKLFNFSPKDFVKYICTSCKAEVFAFSEFPYIDFGFLTQESAENFLKIVNDKIQG